jgi:hypothetical protein
MPTPQDTSGATNGAQVLSAIDNNAAVLELAVKSMAVLANGSVQVTYADDTTATLDFTAGPDGIYSGGGISMDGLTATLSAGIGQLNGQPVEWALTTATCAANPGDTTQYYALIYTGTEPTPVELDGPIASLVEVLSSSTLLLAIIAVPPDTDTVNDRAYVLLYNRRSQESQPMPSPTAGRLLVGTGYGWLQAGRSGRIESDSYDDDGIFRAQAAHSHGFLTLAEAYYYSGLGTVELPADPWTGWRLTILNGSNVDGVESVGLTLTVRGNAYTVNGFVDWSASVSWLKAEIYFDGTHYIVTEA